MTTKTNIVFWAGSNLWDICPSLQMSCCNFFDIKYSDTFFIYIDPLIGSYDVFKGFKLNFELPTNKLLFSSDYFKFILSKAEEYNRDEDVDCDGDDKKFFHVFNGSYAGKVLVKEGERFLISCCTCWPEEGFEKFKKEDESFGDYVRCLCDGKCGNYGDDSSEEE